MGEGMKRRAKRIQHVVAVLAAWDPMGVSVRGSPSEVEEEYRSYAPGVADLLLRGAETSRLRDHLRGICEREMGVRFVEESGVSAAAALRALGDSS